MRTNDTIRNLLGLTQLETAALLGVHVSQWSMYESGQRKLPLAATQRLAEILTHLDSAQAAAKKQARREEAIEEKLRHIEHSMHENAYQQLLLDKKIKALARKQANSTQAELVVDFLENHATQKHGWNQSILSKKTTSTNMHKLALDYEIKSELLQLEKLLLESKRNKLNNQISNQSIFD